MWLSTIMPEASFRIYEDLNAFLEATKNSGKDIYALAKDGYCSV